MKQKSMTPQVLFETQKQVLRDPLQITSGAAASGFGINSSSIRHQSSDTFIRLLRKHKVSLLLSREYEHLLLILNAEQGKLAQSFFPLAHPSGIAVHPSGKQFYVASTRNPNRIVEFSLVTNAYQRTGVFSAELNGKWLPTRSKFYPGATYLHDLVFIQNELYANSVGFNAVFKPDLSIARQEELLWWPPTLRDDAGPETKGNYLQLNSIAAGNSLNSSFFTASTEHPQSYKPGHKKFKVDQKGVVFEGQNGTVIARGLTRPHSARLHKGRIWLCNSGYGQFGYIEKGGFVPLVKLPGWTRGLCFSEDIAFVGVSRILKGFEHYAPGLRASNQECAVYAIDINTGDMVGNVLFPAGNQIFALECLSSKQHASFPFEKVKVSDSKIQQMFYQFQY
jgi:uncharacterized protein (TIGR03032 family)